MKQSTILDFFNGKRAFREKTYTQNDSKIINDAYSELKEKLSPELLALHLKLIDALDDNWASEIELYFVEGFKLGLRIGIESME